MRMLRAAACVLVCAAAHRVAAQNPVRWTLEVSAERPVLAGRAFDATLRATIEKGWHLYAMVQPDSGPAPTVIAVAGGPFEQAGDVMAPPGISEFDPNFNLTTEFFKSQTAFLIPLRAPMTVRNGRHTLEVSASWVTCNDRLCLPPTEALISVAVDVGPRAAAGAAGTTASAAPSRIVITNAPPVDDSTNASPRTAVIDMAAESRASTIGAYLALAALMGALSLLTPCVFPMVPITVSYFTNHAHQHRRDAIAHSVVYGLGIVLTFTLLGFVLAIVFGASGVNRFAANPWVNLGVAAMFVVFALSLFGVRELTLPSRLLSAASSSGAGPGRFAGTLFMGLAFTLTSFTCTAPFLGTLLVVASQGEWQWPLAGMLAFSSVFAAPFVALAFAPQWIASLPRSGAWLVSVTALMGVVELAAAVKFFSNVDLVWGLNVLTRPVVLAVWTALAAVIVLYLAGAIRLGRAPRLGRMRSARALTVAAAAAFALWLASGLSGRRLGELEAFLPPADLTPMSAKGELPWIVNDYEAALAEAANPPQRILIDFTGYTCTNCRWMEANMFPKPEIALELARYVRVRLYTDGRGEPFRGFQAMEQRMFGTVALPYYAVLAPNGDPIVAFSGLTRDAAHYLAFLRKGLK